MNSSKFTKLAYNVTETTCFGDCTEKTPRKQQQENKKTYKEH